jgi:hypothetical protein
MKKMRKILPLALLAVASVFMLSSCDALLDAIFANDTINVQVAVPWTTYGYYPAYDSVTVNIIGPTNVTVTASYTGVNGNNMYWYVSVPKLTNGNYTVNATLNIYLYGTEYSADYFVTLPTGNSHTAYVSITPPYFVP